MLPYPAVRRLIPFILASLFICILWSLLHVNGSPYIERARAKFESFKLGSLRSKLSSSRHKDGLVSTETLIKTSTEKSDDKTHAPRLKPIEETDYMEQWRKGPQPHDLSALNDTQTLAYVNHIMGREKGSFWAVKCEEGIASRYDTLKAPSETGQIHYFFALNLYQNLNILPSLLTAIRQAATYLGPQQCALSIGEGRSTDGTYQVLAAIKTEFEALNMTVHLSTSELSPQDGKQDRIEALAFLRNLALAPLMAEPTKFFPDVEVIFLNDVYICARDILELTFQHRMQNATMTCGMDWSEHGSIFYDIYVSRSITGETFWQIAQDGLWQFSGNLFWADLETKDKYERHQPFKVYACWNGGAVLSGKPIAQRLIEFRKNDESNHECAMGEPTLFSKDLWRLGLGRIMVVPSVNLVYDDEAADMVKDMRGRVEDNLDMSNGDLQTEKVEWQVAPSSLVKCMQEFHKPFWVPST